MPLNQELSDKEFSNLLKKIREKQSAGDKIAISGLIQPAKAFFLSELFQELPLPCLLVTSTIEKAEALFHNMRQFLPQNTGNKVELFVEDEDVPFERRQSFSPTMSVLERLALNEEIFVISTLKATLQKIQDEDSLRRSIQRIKEKETVNLTVLLSLLVEMGYENVPIVEKCGEFSKRGCILDIFPITGVPVRIEFWGDEIESIKILDIETQRSSDSCSSINILPMVSTESSTHIIDYLPDTSWIFLDEPSQIKLISLECNEEKNKLTWEELENHLNNRKVISISSWTKEEEINFNTSVIEPFYGRMENFLEFVNEKQKTGNRILIISPQAKRLTSIIQEECLPEVHMAESPLPLKTPMSFPTPASINIYHGKVDEGFFFEPDLYVITDREILGTIRKTRSIVKGKRQMPTRIEDLNPGDIVVHVLHGVAVYNGLINLRIDNHEKEFLNLSYAKSDKLYVPIDQMHLVQKFIHTGDKNPSLSKLGGKEWKNTRAKVKEEVKNIAEKLLNLYAEREKIPGFGFSPDTPWQGDLENSFPYEETPDQLKAIVEMKKDMEKKRPMDRLICGDSGYGKTEVALRSSFKCVMDGKQVAILVPTTILAEQHYTTFCERLAPFPVKVDLLSRFRTEKEQARTIQNLQDGKVDIIIGTHRLLQKDVVFKELGLVIVDEEQHFGVIHKERLKEMKSQVDILTMTATPIPRTLYLTISGIRDISVISTPPENRLPIKTYIFEYNKDIIKGAILRELERGGQVYFIHNRVKGIELMARTIEALIPGIRVVFAHGQMSEDSLETIMKDFSNREFDVLVCTTIIESGIDIPNVNTIIINNAYGFGLAQLYQLRGRVGRSHRQAYSYLLYPAHRKLGDNARKRMEVLKDFSELGTGFHIAMKDLELRGSGNILGTEQHGFVNAVGFDLYCQLLEEAVREIKGEKPDGSELQAPLIDLPLSAYLPSEYVSDDRQRITLYKRMSLIKQASDAKSLKEELSDRFGPLPEEALNLIFLIRLRILLLDLYIPKMIYEKENVILYMPFSRFQGSENLGRFTKKLCGPSVSIKTFNNKITINDLLKLENWKESLEKILHLFIKEKVLITIA